MRTLITCVAVAIATLAAFQCVDAADPTDNKDLVAEQRRAMLPLAIFDGTWRGPATAISDDGGRVELTQTERVGGLLRGSLKLIEAKGYASDGSVAFNAFSVVSYSPRTGRFNFRSYEQGHARDFAIEVTSDGFTRTVDDGSVKLRYTATVKNGVWSEIGERIVNGQPAARIYEMVLRRVGDTDWPEAGRSAQ